MNGIAGQAGGVVGVRVAAGDREYALRQQLAQAMIDLPGLPLVPQAGGQFIQQSIATIGGLQQQSSTVGAALSLIKLGNDRLAKNSWEQQTLCCAIVRHYGSLFCYSKHCLVNMFVTEEAFFCLQIRELSGLDGQKRQCRVRTSNAGHCLYTRVAKPEHAPLVAQGLLGPDFFSGWGVRTVGAQEARYNPISYHNGSVWPHDNALIDSGLSKYGIKDLASRILSGLLDTSVYVDLHRLPELFCGLHRRAEEGPTVYPVACSPQAWAAASVFLLLQACLGISIDGNRKQVVLDAPYLPENITELWIKGLEVKGSRVDLFLERRTDVVRVRVLDNQGKIDVIVK